MRIEEGVELSRLTTIGTGGPARAFARPATVADLEEALSWAAGEDLPVAPVGLGSNLLAADDGVEMLVLRLAGELAAVAVDPPLLRAGGGASLAVCLHRAREAELGRLEFTCAIPGTAGGGVWMNAGAYGGEIAGVLERALVVEARRATVDDARRARAAVPALGVASWAGRGPGRAPARGASAGGDQADRRGMQDRRKAAQPTNKRTFGSVFKNPDHELSAGRMLEACGLRGSRSAARRSPHATRTSSRTPTPRGRRCAGADGRGAPARARAVRRRARARGPAARRRSSRVGALCTGGEE